MCGIICTNSGISPEILARAVAHRGTLPPAWVQSAGFCFLHTLMPVQGGEPIKQPYTGNGRILLFQGELWKHPGFASDTEYLFDCLCKEGAKVVVGKLEGMFAFVFSDGSRLWFASDIFGEQPLYYHHTNTSGFFGGTLSIASEHKQLRACGVLAGDIQPCLPGRVYRYDIGSQRLNETVYHAFDYNQQRTTEVDYKKLRGLVAASCRDKYEAVSLQRPGLLLSGGMDSSIMAYELSKLGLSKAFTVGLDPNNTDFITAEKTAEKHGLELVKILCETLDPDISMVMAESRNKSIVEEYICHLAMAQYLSDYEYRVVLTGSGADELFIGYSYYLRFSVKGQRNKLQEKLMDGYHRLELRTLNKVYMSKAVEIRSPFLDKRLAEYACTLDADVCLVGEKNVMKKALRDAYADRIDCAHNPKVIAGRTMGVIGHFEGIHGGDARAYHARYKEVWSDNTKLFALLARAEQIKYTII